MARVDDFEYSVISLKGGIPVSEAGVSCILSASVAVVRKLCCKYLLFIIVM